MNKMSSGNWFALCWIFGHNWEHHYDGRECHICHAFQYNDRQLRKMTNKAIKESRIIERERQSNTKGNK